MILWLTWLLKVFQFTLLELLEAAESAGLWGPGDCRTYKIATVPYPQNKVPVCAHKGCVTVVTQTTMKNGACTGTHKSTQKPHVNMSLTNSLNLFFHLWSGQTNLPTSTFSQKPSFVTFPFYFLMCVNCQFTLVSSFPISSPSLKHPLNTF